MAEFRFVARDVGGRVYRGSERAESAVAAMAALRSRGWSIIDVRAVEGAGPSLAESLGVLQPKRWLPVRSFDVELSLQQIAVMLRGGLTLLSALRQTADQCPRLSMRRVWSDVADRVQSGSGLADSLARHRCFPPLVVQLARIGEQTGNLEPVLKRGAEALERKRALRNTLLTALAYPSLVFVASLGVTAFMVFNVIPKLEEFLLALGRELPAMTRNLIEITGFVRRTAPQAALVAVGAALVVGWLFTWSSSRMIIDRWALRVPVIGPLLRLSATALVARSLSMLLRSGVTLLESLRTIEMLPRNLHLRSRIGIARAQIMEGGSLADGLKSPYGFQEMLPSMVAVGETTGTLDEVLEETARFQEDRLQVAIRRFALILEPAIVVVVGGIVGYVYIAFFVALFAAAGPGGL